VQTRKQSTNEAELLFLHWMGDPGKLDHFGFKFLGTDMESNQHLDSVAYLINRRNRKEQFAPNRTLPTDALHQKLRKIGHSAPLNKLTDCHGRLTGDNWTREILDMLGPEPD